MTVADKKQAAIIEEITEDAQIQPTPTMAVPSLEIEKAAAKEFKSEVVVRADRTTRAYQDFLLGSKLFWSRTLYRELYDEYKEVAARLPEPPQSADEVEKLMRPRPTYQFYGWLERHIQRLKYAGPFGIAPTADKQRVELTAALEVAASEGSANGELRLQPTLEMPRYYSQVDFHQHPGGVWSDELAGLVYEFGRKTTTPMHLHEDDLHFRLAAAIKQVAPEKQFASILDWGCGIGKSTYPFSLAYPEAEVYGVDISAPCLKLAYLRTNKEKGLHIKYSQQNIEYLDYPDNSFDLVHGTFMPHEFPATALKRAVAEVYRILKPGGYFVNLDFHNPPGGAFGEFIYYGHARRNNEVFMRVFNETDYLKLERELGFSQAEMLPFDDGTGLITDQTAVPAAWRFPWQLFVAKK